MKRRTWVLAVLALVIGVGLLIVLSPATPTDMAEAALASDDSVVVSDDDWLLFEPVGATTTGLVFYPGGLVPPAAYAPLARAIAEEGYVVVVPRMPLNLAVFAPSRAGDVLSEMDGIERWAVGGHSLGGAMAAQYVSETTGPAGLIMVAAYPSSRIDLTDRDVDVLVIYGSQDGLFTVDEVVASVAQYPDDAVFVEIVGGNHAQFGSYGEQRGDNPASIPSTAQLSQTADAMVTFLNALDDS